MNVPSVLAKLARFLLKYGYALSSCLYLFTVGFLFKKNRDLLSAICFHFGYGKRTKPSPVPLLPKIEIREILHGEYPVKILEPEFQRGNTSLYELCVINQLIWAFQPKRLFELGTFDGRTALNMAANAPEEAVVYTLDLPPDSSVTTRLPVDPGDLDLMEKRFSRFRYQGRPEERKIVQLIGDTATFDFTPFFNTIDFVFIDASHSYEYVCNDTELALKLLRGGRGTIL